MSSRRRLAVVLSHPTQYYSPWFRWLATRAPVELRVFYLWDFGVRAQTDRQFGTTIRWDVDLLSGYASEFVPNAARDPGTHHFFGIRNPGLGRRLAAWRPDALLLFGYGWAGCLQALGWARRRHVPVILRGDSHRLARSLGPGLPGLSLRARLQGGLRMSILRRLLRSFAAVTYVGAANRRYLEHLGVPAKRLFFAPHAVDADRFRPDDPAVRAAAAELRRQCLIPEEARVVLFAGKFIPAKQPLELLRAFQQRGAGSAVLLFVGDGSEKAALERAARERPDVPVRFLPFANQSEMPARYQAADLFALPSKGAHETWGLAVNEAMHLGVPALVSDRVGCQEDLVTAGETGWVFRADDPGDLRRQLDAALAELADPRRRGALRGRVLRRIESYSFERAAAGLLQALDYATGGSA